MAPKFRFSASSHFAQWLADEQISLVCTAEFAGLILTIGLQPNAELGVTAVPCPRPAGLYADPDQLLLSSHGRLWRLTNALNPGETSDGFDRLFLPHTSHVIGDLDIHDIAVDTTARVLFTATRYNCLATLSDRQSFTPLWQPPFISELVPEERCHLTGVALIDGTPRYATAAAQTDTLRGWQAVRRDGGCLIDIEHDAVVLSGLSLPHTPRQHQDRIWLANTGMGEIGYFDAAAGRFEPVTACPGYARCLALHGNYAIVGLTRPLSGASLGLPLEDRAAAAGEELQSGLLVVDLQSGVPIHWLQLTGEVYDIADIGILPGIRRPAVAALEQPTGFVTFVTDRAIVRHTISDPQWAHPTPAQSDPVPAPPATQRPRPAGYRFQLSRDMSVAAVLRQYGDLTFPNLARLISTRSLREPLIAVVARHQNTIAGMALAELRPDGSAELLSLYVQPPHRGRGVGSALLANLERALAGQGVAALDLVYRDEWSDAAQLERILARAGWMPPVARMLLCKATTTSIAAAPWLAENRMPAGFSVFPWVELSAAEKQAILARQAHEPWFPQVLTPFQEEQRLEPLNSLGLRHEDEVVGWMVTHRLAPDTIQYTSLFVRPPFQGLGRAVPLLAAAIRRQCETDILNGIFQVEVANQPMVRFVERRMRPYLVGLTTARVSRKTLPATRPARPA